MMKAKLSFLGECPIPPAKLVAELFTQALQTSNVLQASPKSVPERKAWTSAIKGTLKEIAERTYRSKKAMLQVLFSRREEETSTREWLLDVVWWVNGLGATLGAECEWNTSPTEIEIDFEKLLAFKAPLKLMIYQTKDHDSDSKVIRETLSACMMNYHHHLPHETYVLLELSREDTAYAWRFVIPENGNFNGVEWEEIYSAPKRSAA